MTARRSPLLRWHHTFPGWPQRPCPYRAHRASITPTATISTPFLGPLQQTPSIPGLRTDLARISHRIARLQIPIAQRSD